MKQQIYLMPYDELERVEETVDSTPIDDDEEADA